MLLLYLDETVYLLVLNVEVLKEPGNNVVQITEDHVKFSVEGM